MVICMPPQITCPHCGSTINLENRKEVDYDKILFALSKSQRTFSELLMMTDLPRKTLSIRLKDLCTSGAIIKDGGYRLSASVAPDHFRNSIQRKKGNGKMHGSILHIGKNVQWLPVALIICLLTVTFGSAILLNPPPPQPRYPNPIFVFRPSSDLVSGQLVTFDASSSFDLDGRISSYFWEFGDGTTGSGKIVTHAYYQEGTYQVVLQVTDNQGHSSTSFPRLVRVSESMTKTIRFTISPDPNRPEAGWETRWIVNKRLTFDGSTFDAAKGFMESYLWDFGDGSPQETGVTVSHAYEAEGEYTVSLTVSDLSGNPHTFTEEITILAIPTTTIYASVPGGYQVGDTITVNIMLADITGLFSWQAGMTFNPTVLECITSAPPDNAAGDPQYTVFIEDEFLRQGGDTMWFAGTMDNNIGTIGTHGVTLLNPAMPVSGSGILATVTFKVIGEGDPSLHLNSVILMNGAYQEIPVYVAT